MHQNLQRCNVYARTFLKVLEEVGSQKGVKIIMDNVSVCKVVSIFFEVTILIYFGLMHSSPINIPLSWIQSKLLSQPALSLYRKKN